MGKKRGSQYPWFHKWIKGRIDQVWGWSPERKVVKARTYVSKELFKCEGCHEVRHVDEREIDHVVPRVPVTGWDGWDGYIARSFVPEDQLRALCQTCHKAKSEGENAERPHRKRKKKDTDVV